MLKASIEIKKHMLDLVQKINQWNKEYFLDNNPSVSDLVYDKALLELEELEKKYPLDINPNSPTQNVGGYLNNKFQKVLHDKEMLSLSKAYNYDEITKFIENVKKIVPIEKINFSLEPKIDGLSISLHYKNGYLIRALTRGDGKEGEDVTDNIKVIDSIPKIINYENSLEVRGEIFLSKENFKILNESFHKKGEKGFANPRNAASGTLRQLDNKVVLERNLSAFLYELVEPNKHNINTQKDAIKFIKELNLPVNNLFKVVEIEDLEEEINNFAEIKNNLAYDTDGLVIKLNNLTYWEKLGKTAKFPKHSIAFKYDIEQAISTILDIKATVGRTGKITYVANLTPVELNQTIVQNATLHNYNFIKLHNIDIGDEVIIIKAGEIIPKILDTVNKKSTTNYHKVLFCPSCNYELKEIEGNVDQYCLNKFCEEKMINSLIHFCSRKALNIAGLGENTIREFFKNNILRNILDIFSLEEKKEIIQNLPNFGSLKYKNIIDSINERKKCKFSDILFALGIKHLGERASKILANNYNNFAELLNDKELEKITNLTNIGPKTIESLKNYINDDENKIFLLKLESYLNYFETNKMSLSNNLFNLSFAITGKLSKNRDYFQNLILSHGGKVSNSLSSKTSYLLAGEDAGSKLLKAKELKIKIINEEEFNLLISKEQ
ncbi:NAD-dependent DNA ligase LigA [Mycoplasmopsis meleagridis]|uniref:NAD-dependent DNA ligase LigA n=1 Tax=Mycoplasmopsis meleagridis TaxID=29561 RepID=UPI003A869712